MDTAPPPGTRYGVPARRKAIVEQLSQAYGNDMLDQAEFERRLERAEAATTIEDLNALVADFGAAASAPPDQRQVLADSPRHFLLLGEQTHVLVPGTDAGLRATMGLGSLVIDLRAFRGTGATIPVHVGGGIGEVKLKVPEGTLVVRRLRMLMGDFSTKHARRPGTVTKFFRRLFGSPGAPPAPATTVGSPPTVVLTGFWFLASVQVEEHLP